MFKRCTRGWYFSLCVLVCVCLCVCIWMKAMRQIWLDMKKILERESIGKGESGKKGVMKELKKKEGKRQAGRKEGIGETERKGYFCF